LFFNTYQQTSAKKSVNFNHKAPLSSRRSQK